MPKTIKSAILSALIAATGLKDTDPTNAKSLTKLVLAACDLADKDWNSLSSEAQEWNNVAADAINAKKELPAFPDAEEDTPEPAAPARRRGAAAAEPEATKDKELDPADVQEGEQIEVTTKRGKVVAGECIEVSKRKEYLVIKSPAGDEDEFDFDKIAKVTVMAAGATDEPAAGDAEPAIGDTVKLTNKRGKVYEGVITEMSSEEVVLDCNGEVEDFDLEKVTDITVISKGDAKKEEPAAPSRRGAKADAKKEEPAEAPEKKRSSNPAGVSVGGRIRELMCEDLGISEEAVSKTLKKEGIEFRDTSLKMIYKDTMAVISLLIANKHMKAAK